MTKGASATIDTARYIVWMDYGSEGWRPRYCTSWDEVLTEINGNNAGQEWIITRPVALPEPKEGG